MKNISLIERRIILLTSLGSILEYYDFVIYGMLAKYLKPIFFSTENETTAFLQLFSIFAIGYLARPFGGFIAGMVGDRFGRKPVFLLLTTLMAFSTLLIGFLPTYEQIGSSATLILVFCRLIQGLSFGGELPGATTIVTEFSSNKNRSFRLSFIVVSATAGALLASFVLFCLTSLLSETDICAGGWRIPFIIGGVLGIILFLIRKKLLETPLFQTNRLPKIEFIKQLFSNHRVSFMVGIMLTLFLSAMVIGNLYFPYYINHYYGIPEKNIYFAITLSLIASMIMVPLAGKFADNFSKTKLLQYTTLSYLVLSFLFFKLLSYQSLIFIVLFLIIHQFYIALFSACYFPILTTLFPPVVRYTGIAICYNLVYGLMGTLPAILTSLLNTLQEPNIMPLFLSVMAFMSYSALNYLKFNKALLVENLT